MSTKSKSRFIAIRVGFVSLLFVAISGFFTPATALETGGDDIIIWTDSVGGFVKAGALDVLDDGRMFAAGVYENDSTGFEIRVYRSLDGGQTWEFWGVLRDEDPNVNYYNPDMLVAEGQYDWLFVAYEYQAPGVNEIRVSRASPYISTAIWSDETIVSISDMWLRHPTLATDDINYAGYNIYLAYSHYDYNGQDVWFSKSTNNGQSWTAPYVVLPSSSSSYDYQLPDLACGFDGRIHLVATRNDRLVDEGVITHRFATGRAYSAGNWDGVTTWLSDNTDAYLEILPKVRASASDGQVLVAYDVLDGPVNLGSILRSSEDGGDTWPVENTLDMGDFGVYAIAYDVAAGFAMLVQHSPTYVGLATPVGSDLTGLWMSKEFMDYRTLEPSLPDGALACDPAHDSRWCAIKAQKAPGDDPQLHFDGVWRGGPGYPNYEDGFPLELADGVLTDPVVANLDSDNDLEIAYADYVGNLHLIDTDGQELPGWPRPLQTGPTRPTIAVGDIDGDGVNEIVASNNHERVFAFELDGSPVDGWPIELGTGYVAPAMISLGPVTGLSPLNVVITQSNFLFVYDHQGNPVHGFPRDVVDVTHSPAAIGDVDDDGDVEILTAAGSRVLIFSPTGGVERSINVNGTLWESVSLADVDFDGDLEIAIPATNGRVFLKHHDGTDLPGWPVSDPAGSWINGVALASIVGSGSPEVIFSTWDGCVHGYRTNGDEIQGWPNTTGGHIPGTPIVDSLWDDEAHGVVVGAENGQIYGWKNLGDQVPGWPKELLGPITGTPAAGDIDNDGRLEIVFGTENSLEVVDLNNPASEWGGYYWRMAYFNAQRTSCLDCDLDTLTGIDDEVGVQTTRVRFMGGFPNPAADDLYLRYQLPAHAAVSLRVYDIEGRLIRKLMREEQSAGAQVVYWDGLDDHGVPVSSGVYYARLLVRGPGMRKDLTRAVSIMR